MPTHPPGEPLRNRDTPDPGDTENQGFLDSHRSLATLLGHLPGMAYRCRNDPQWTMEFVSEGAFRLTAHHADELIGNAQVSFADLIHPADRDAVWTAVQRAVDRAEAYQMEYRISTAEGREKWVWERGRGIFADDGRLLYLEGFITDITDRKRAEDEQVRLRSQVQHSQKLESLGQMAGGIAHDFNNILLAILGNADLALEDLPEGAPARRWVEEIEAAARRAADLTRQMLAYSGRGRLEIREADINEIVVGVTPLLKSSISKKTDLRTDLTRGLPAIRADVAQMEQVIMNLVLNASEALDPERGGRVVVATGLQDCSPDDLERAQPPDEAPSGRCVFLEVSDNGCGMDANTIERLFDPFFTTKFTGRGLGMSAVLGIVRGHTGAIVVDSVPAQGTTVRVLFPAIDAPAGTLEHGGRHEADRSWRGSGTILLVDDEQAVRALGRHLLERLGFGVVTASDGIEALEAYRNHAGEFACVVLDRSMPGLDGAQVLGELKRLDPDVRVVLSSGLAESQLEEEFGDRGVSACLTKPYRLKVLAETLRLALGGSPREP
jgi:PAS domain S-box-containing protein